MADDIRKGLGIRRRKPAGEAAQTDAGESGEGEAPKRRPAPSKSSSSGPLLGIRRRRGPEAKAAEAEAPADADESAKDAEASAESSEEATTEAPAGGGLGSDQTAVVLANHFKIRPKLRERLPERLFGLNRTHGRYLGDGRPERKLEVGFKPGLVLYTIPPWGYDGPPKYGKEGIVETGLHRQPSFGETSFTVDEAFNKIGDMYIYVVFEDDGKPLEVEDKKKSKRRSSESGRSSGPLLGIKRRK